MKIQAISIVELVLIYHFPMQHLDGSRKGFLGNFQFQINYQFPSYWLKSIEFPHLLIINLIISTILLFLRYVYYENKINFAEVVVFNGYLLFLSYPLLEIVRLFFVTVYKGSIAPFQLYFTIYYWICWLISLYIIINLYNDNKYNLNDSTKLDKMKNDEELKFWIIFSIILSFPSLMRQSYFISSIYYLFAELLLHPKPSRSTLSSLEIYFFIVASIAISIYLGYLLVSNINRFNSRIEFGLLICYYNSISWLLIFSDYLDLINLKHGTLLFVHITDLILLNLIIFVPAFISKLRSIESTVIRRQGN